MPQSSSTNFVSEGRPKLTIRDLTGYYISTLMILITIRSEESVQAQGWDLEVLRLRNRLVELREAFFRTHRGLVVDPLDAALAEVRVTEAIAWLNDNKHGLVGDLLTPAGNGSSVGEVPTSQTAARGRSS